MFLQMVLFHFFLWLKSIPLWGVRNLWWPGAPADCSWRGTVTVTFPRGGKVEAMNVSSKARKH